MNIQDRSEALRVLMRWVFFVLAICVLWPFRIPLAVGMSFAFLCETPYFAIIDKLSRKVSWTDKSVFRWLLAFIFVLLIYVCVLTPIISFLYVAVVDLFRYVTETSPYGSLLDSYHQLMSQVQEWMKRLPAVFSFENLIGQAKSTGIEILKKIMEQLGDGVKATPQIVMHTFIMIFVWVGFLVNGKIWRAQLLPMILPWDEERHMLCSLTGNLLQSAIFTNLVTSMCQGLLVALVSLIAGLPDPHLWGVMGFICSFIPLVGTFAVLLCGAAYLYFQGSTGWAIVVLFSSGVIGLVDNVIRPLLMKGGAELSFFWLFFGILGGLIVFGVPGIVLGPLIFSVCKEFIKRHKSLA